MTLIVFFKPMIALCAGLCVFLAVLFVLPRVLSRAARLLDRTGQKAKGLPPAAGGDYLRCRLKTLSEDPGSPRSRKLRTLLALCIALVSFLALDKLIFSLLSAGLAYYFIGWYFNRKIRKKTALFNDQLIEALGMLTNSVRAGQSLQQAMENMTRDSRPPLSPEFEEVLRQVQLGTSLNEALSAMANRVNSRDLKMAVTSINLSKETGGSLGEILAKLSSTMRERKKIQGKIRALTAQGRGSGMVLAVVPFLLLAILYFMQPDVMGLMFSTTPGNIMLAVVAVMISTAVFVINKMIDIDI
ncbi:MAG: type II secretion system F family protein [Endomicrobiales bacterium]